MIEPTAEKLIAIQSKIILESDLPEDEGMAGSVRDQGTLDYIVSDYNWKENIFEHASWLYYKIATEHPFFQWNKRTAIAVAENVLAVIGFYISASEKEIEEFTIKIASFNVQKGEYEYKVNDVEKWLLRNVDVIKKG
ncbi:MAG: type II toxin-antitoxin system death-on-curing family toxin [Methanomicrobiaceae archaeon]|nr:type II toxin-antitoxin system death-on-curing family toxin [Methanomicrobiaceae archaeon]